MVHVRMKDMSGWFTIALQRSSSCVAVEMACVCGMPLFLWELHGFVV